MAASVAVARAPADPLVVRRLEMPDLQQHGKWLMPRLLQIYSDLPPANIWGWLNNMLYSNEFLFLYQEHAVACAQTMHGHSLAPRPVVHERWLFVENKEDPAHIEAGAAFYADYVRWGKAQDAEAVILSELSDVPTDKIPKAVGRLFQKTQNYLKL